MSEIDRFVPLPELSAIDVACVPPFNFQAEQNLLP